MSPHGLVLAGGLSSRMGRDKGKVVYPTLSPLDQHARSVALLSPYCDGVFVSCRAQQLPIPFPVILDSVPGCGPAAGILSAHAKFPEASWLVLACDFPFAGPGSVKRLVSARQEHQAATCFTHADGAIEPLFAIWEPKALRMLKAAFTTGERSPRRVLEMLACALVPAPPGRALLNVNEPLPSLEML